MIWSAANERRKAMRNTNRYRLARQYAREAKADVEAALAQEQQEGRARHAATAPARDIRERAKLAAWDALKAGDCITVGNNPVVIARKSQWSLRDTMGLTWSMTEITGLRRERVDALRREDT